MGFNNRTATCGNYDDLRLQIGESACTMKVLGRSTINDGFGATFYWDGDSTEPDDDDKFVQPLYIYKGRWVRLDEVSGTLSGTRTATVVGGFNCTVVHGWDIPYKVFITPKNNKCAENFLLNLSGGNFTFTFPNVLPGDTFDFDWILIR